MTERGRLLTAAAKRYVAGDASARAEVLARAEGLVRGMVKAWVIGMGWSSRPGLDRGDLVSEGRLAIMRALETYDGSTQFSTYATLWIRSYVGKLAARMSYPIALNAQAISELVTAERGDNVRTTNGHAKPPESLDRIRMAMRCMSLESLVRKRDRFLFESGPSGRANALWIVADPRSGRDHVVEDFDRSMTVEFVRDAVAGLDERTAEIIRMRWGLDGRRESTLAEVGKAFGITKERARQIEAKGRKQLGELLRARSVA